MEGRKAFKVWNRTRTLKKCVIIHQTGENLYENLVLSASAKLEIDGSALVLEADGTTIEGDEELLFYGNEVLILLTKTESWVDPMTLVGSSFSVTGSQLSEPSTSSTITVVDGMELGQSEPIFINLNDKENIQNVYEVSPNYNLLWRNMEIPWQRLSPENLKQLQDGERNKTLTKKTVNLVVDEMRTIKKQVPLNAFKITANKVITRYPNSFMDQDEDGQVFGDGSTSLMLKLVDHNNYLNKQDKRKVPKDQSSSTSFAICGKRRKLLTSRAGCVDWEGETLDIQVEQQMNSDGSNNPEEFLKEHLLLHYAAQRKFLNDQKKVPTATEIKETWPLLTNPEYLRIHFEKLTKVNLDMMDHNLDSKQAKILEYAQTKNIKFESAIDDKQKVIMYFAHHLKEDWSFVLYKMNKDEDNINVADQLKTNAVCIVELERDNFVIYLERTPFMECSSFIQAFKSMFAMYFVLNLKFPPECHGTLEVVQRYLLKIHPDSGSKSNLRVFRRVRTFVDMLSKL